MVRAPCRRRCRPRTSCSPPPTAPGSPRRSPTTSSATARSSRSCATRTSPRSWSTGPTASTSSAAAGCSQGRGPLHRRGAPASHHRQDRVPDRPSRRRVEPDGRRPAPRRQPRQRGHPAARRSTARCSPSASSRPTRTPPTTWSRSAPTRSAPPTSSSACVRGPAQHHRLRQHRRRQDDDAQRAVVVHPDRRAHRHHRGRRRAPAAPGPRAAARVPPVQHRGQGRGRDPRPGQELAAHASRPHRRRRGPRRLGARHAAGHEHRPRRLASARCTPTARATRWPASRRWC